MDYFSKKFFYFLLLISNLSFATESYLFNLSKTTPFSSGGLSTSKFNCYLEHDGSKKSCGKPKSFLCIFGEGTIFATKKRLPLSNTTNSMSIAQNDGNLTVSYKLQSPNMFIFKLLRNNNVLDFSVQCWSNQFGSYDQSAKFFNKISIDASSNKIAIIY